MVCIVLVSTIFLQYLINVTTCRQSRVITTYMSNLFLGSLHRVAAGYVTDVSKEVKCLPAYVN